MPRFGLKGVLVVFTVVAVWFSTFAGYVGSEDVRSSIVMLTVAASGSAAYCNRGRRKCFWLGFFFVLLVTAMFQTTLAPQMIWVANSVRPLVTPIDIYGDARLAGPSTQRVECIAATIRLASNLILATAAGFIGFYVYDHSSRPGEH